jgi:hypothetical protein
LVELARWFVKNLFLKTNKMSTWIKHLKALDLRLPKLSGFI